MADKEKLGSLKPKFTPTIPTKRVKAQESAPSSSNNETKGQRKGPRRQKKPVEASQMVASGPFALGPAKRGQRISQPSSGHSTVYTRKSEGTAKAHAFYEEEEEEELQEKKVTFTNDPLAPVTLDVSSDLPTDFLSTIPDAMQSDVKMEKQEIPTIAMFQLPPMLLDAAAHSTMKQEPVESKKQVKVEKGQQGMQGKIGTLKFTAKGDMWMEFHGLKFKVKQSPQCYMKQHLVFLDDAHQTAGLLGQVKDRYVCSLDGF